MYVFVSHFAVLHVFLTVGYDLKTLKATRPVGISDELGSRRAKAFGHHKSSLFLKSAALG